MEEKKKRNVEDIVSKLRQPAVITSRNSKRALSTSSKQFESLPVSVFHYDKDASSKSVANSMKASSLLSMVDKCDQVKKTEELIYTNYNFDEVKDSCTQTSKTIIQLAKLETGEMSPDSLSPTPRNCKYANSENFENFTLDGSVTESYSYCRKNNLVQYLQGYEDELEKKDTKKSVGPYLHAYENNAEEDSRGSSVKKNNVIQYLQSLEDDLEVPDMEPETELPVQEFPKKSLIETYLEKSRSRTSSNFKKLQESLSGDRLKFLQTSLPNKIMDEDHAVKHDFKSQSLVDSNHLNVENDRIQPQFTRFTVKNIRERNHVNIMYTDTIYERSRDFRTRKSSSFMQPTVASEQKSKMDEVRAIKHLISPTRRGRSKSPGISVTNKVEVFKHESDKIPYIDQSRSELTSPRFQSNKERITLVERSKTPNKIVPALPAADFQRDMMRIDQLSLTLLPSDDSFTDRSRVTDNYSVSSIENSLGDLLCRIQDSDWNISLKALADATELCRTVHVDIMLPHMITINQKLIELLRSPRSHVCRTSCQAAGHLFESMKDTRGPEFNDIVDILLGKTADANKFIRQDANLALDCMVTHIPTFHAIRALCSRGPTHKNHLVRCATVRLIICAAVIASPSAILNPAGNEHTRKRIFSNMIRFLEDKHLETRKYGERLYKVMSKEPNFDQYLRKYMDRDDMTRMRKSLKFLYNKK